jgi:putative FmdB family regulatory protein
MPIYEYKCPKCGYRFAMLEPLGTPTGGRECPICGSKETNRTISAFSTKQSDKKPSSCKPGGG